MDYVPVDDLLVFIVRSKAQGLSSNDILNEIVLSLLAFKNAGDEKADDEENK